MTNWKELDDTYIMPLVQRLPIAIARGEGNYLYDTEGKRYLDMFTGLAVNVLGHSHPRLMAALEEQGHSFLHISNFFLNPPAIQLAERLVTQTFGKGKVFFSNSGAEATEAIIKLVFKWTVQEQNERAGVVVVTNSFHGRTSGAMRLTRQPSVYQDYPTADFPVFEVEPNNIAQLREMCEQNRPAAVLVEPILGSGGVTTLDTAYIHAIAEICKEKGMLFVMDEIQTGMGRTGSLFAYQELGVQPDLILFAKGVGGGLPLGGIIASERVQDVFKPGDHGTTFAPSSLSAAMGNAVLDVLLEEGGLEQGRQAAAELWHELEALRERHPQVINYMDGRGMMIGVRTHLSVEEVNKLRYRLLEHGVLVDVTARTIIRLLPPLTLKSEDIRFFVKTFEACLSE